MQTSHFDFLLPESLIATRPAEPRESARLLCVGVAVDDKHIADLPSLLNPGDILVFNDSRVLPARLHGVRGAVKVEVLLHKPLHLSSCGPQSGSAGSHSTPRDPALALRAPQDDSVNRWLAFARPAKRLKQGDVIVFDDQLHATVGSKHDDGQVELVFNHSGPALVQHIERAGEIPLPPYISHLRQADPRDRTDYQTSYAKGEAASVAAPTAGLHFTPALMEQLKARGVQFAFVTLHVGAGTFLPVKVDDTRDHVMHSEFAVLTPESAQAINTARAIVSR